MLYDGSPGSPVERLSRQARTTLPVSIKLLAPTSNSNSKLKAQLTQKQCSQKRCYDRSSKPLHPLSQREMIKLQTPKGYNRMRMIKEICNQCCWIRRDEIQMEWLTHFTCSWATSATAQRLQFWRSSVTSFTQAWSRSSTTQHQRNTNISKACHQMFHQTLPVTESETNFCFTLSGRISRPNPKYMQKTIQEMKRTTVILKWFETFIILLVPC